MSFDHSRGGSLTDVSFTLPSWGEVLNVLTFQAGYNSALVMAGASMLGIAAGVVGSFALLRKRSLMGDALAHSALPGLALAFIAAALLGYGGRSLALLLSGAALSGILGVIVIQVLTRHTRLSEDTAIGAVLSIFFGLGVVLLSIIQSMQSGGAAGLNHFIYGQTAAMRTIDAYFIISAALLTAAGAALLIKEFSLVCFDPEFAAVQGWPITFIDLLMMGLVTIVTVVGLQSVGIILIVALLIVPAAAARFWTESLSKMVLISAVTGGISGYFGSAASTLLPRFPAGSVIVLTAGVIFIFSFLIAPRRGVLFGLARIFVMRLRVVKDHLLRDYYEFCERSGVELDSAVPATNIPFLRRMRPAKQRIVLAFMAIAGRIKVQNGNISLTDKGRTETKRLVRNHRMWEEYIHQYAQVSPSHVDYSADYVEHILSKDVIRRLEERLTERGRMPGNESIHPLKERT